MKEDFVPSYARNFMQRQLQTGTRMVKPGYREGRKESEELAAYKKKYKMRQSLLVSEDSFCPDLDLLKKRGEKIIRPTKPSSFVKDETKKQDLETKPRSRKISIQHTRNSKQKCKGKVTDKLLPSRSGTEDLDAWKNYIERISACAEKYREKKRTKRVENMVVSEQKKPEEVNQSGNSEVHYEKKIPNVSHLEPDQIVPESEIQKGKVQKKHVEKVRRSSIPPSAKGTSSNLETIAQRNSVISGNIQKKKIGGSTEKENTNLAEQFKAKVEKLEKRLSMLEEENKKLTEQNYLLKEMKLPRGKQKFDSNVEESVSEASFDYTHGYSVRILQERSALINGSYIAIERSSEG
eukprot:snap_masked-scaffold_6-processed-gene-10.29-mRNA-1 protein AED:1.00 eAED:1.00 QI:0/0/0/0/1/1/2/0/349